MIILIIIITINIWQSKNTRNKTRYDYTKTPAIVKVTINNKVIT